MKYLIKTFGCQMNVSDSERIAGFLEMHKFKPATSVIEADIAIFNTCGVRQSAEDRVYGQIHNLRKKYSKIKIVLTGCLANRKDVQRRLKDKVEMFCEIKDFSKSISKILNTKYKIPNSSCKETSYLKIISKYTNKHTAFVPIMTGCNNFCSYCVVPYARGREESRPADDVLKEIRALVENGCREIILLGQNVNSYKWTLRVHNGREASRIIFPDLLKSIERIPGRFWISFISSHPKDYSDELIETVAKSKKICEYVHLPIQAGDDQILEKMNRKYTAKHYLKLVMKIKSAFKKHKPGVLYSITSDIIVGFPNETRKQFLESARIMEKVKYDMVYFGQFSSRPGTAAAKVKDNISKQEKERREKYLTEILIKTTLANNKKYVGKIMEVLVDKKRGDIYFGHTRTMKNIKIISNKKDLAGRIVIIKITKANTWNLEGKTIK